MWHSLIFHRKTVDMVKYDCMSYLWGILTAGRIVVGDNQGPLRFDTDIKSFFDFITNGWQKCIFYRTLSFCKRIHVNARRSLQSEYSFQIYGEYFISVYPELINSIISSPRYHK